MSKDDLGFVVMILTICVAIVLIVGLVLYYDFEETKLFVENGYEQVMLPGSSVTHWEIPALEEEDARHNTD